MDPVHYGIGRTFALSFDEADHRIRQYLAEEGFGILTEIDVRATLRKTIGMDVPRYTIMGAWNPRIAHQAILCEPDVGLLLPCNVVVREVDADHTVVEALDPVSQLGIAGNIALEPLASQARELLARALQRVGEG